LTDTVYRRQKHPFLAPPAAVAPTSRLFTFLSDTVRGPAFAASPFYDQAKVVALLDEVPRLDREAQRGVDAMLMVMLSFAVLQQELGVSA
jgi:asparagine synthase (glutamine-hydrolysing)